MIPQAVSSVFDSSVRREVACSRSRKNRIYPGLPPFVVAPSAARRAISSSAVSGYPEMFELLAEKLGTHPDAVGADFDETRQGLVSEDSGLAATWFDSSFDPDGDAAIPFNIRFNASVPAAEAMEPPRPSPVYLPADAIAVYAPWHIYRDDFGAYIKEDELLALASRVAEDLMVGFSEIAPHILRQIVLHEQAHFMFEIAAAEVEDVSEEWLYRRYVSSAGPAPPLTDGGPRRDLGVLARGRVRQASGRQVSRTPLLPRSRCRRASPTAAGIPRLRTHAARRQSRTCCRGFTDPVWVSSRGHRAVGGANRPRGRQHASLLGW